MVERRGIVIGAAPFSIFGFARKNILTHAEDTEKTERAVLRTAEGVQIRFLAHIKIRVNLCYSCSKSFLCANQIISARTFKYSVRYL